MSTELTALGDPPPDQVLLGTGQPTIGFLRRHSNIRVVAGDFLPKKAFLWLAGHEQWWVVGQGLGGDIQSQVGLPSLRVGSVTLEAVFRKDWTDVSLEVDL